MVIWIKSFQSVQVFAFSLGTFVDLITFGKILQMKSFARRLSSQKISKKHFQSFKSLVLFSAAFKKFNLDLSLKGFANFTFRHSQNFLCENILNLSL